jgi:hypothetical protein
MYVGGGTSTEIFSWEVGWMRSMAGWMDAIVLLAGNLSSRMICLSVSCMYSFMRVYDQERDDANADRRQKECHEGMKPISSHTQQKDLLLAAMA